MPMIVQNNEQNATAFTKTIGGDPVRIIWGTKGQPNDTQRVPDSFADDIDFLNALDQGILTVISGPPELLEKIGTQQEQTANFREEQLSRQRASAEEVMNRVQDKSMVGLTCIGPGFRPGQICARPVLVAHTQVDEVPPLCEEHESLAPTFSLMETGSRGRAEDGASQSREGIVRREWKQAVITPRQRDMVSAAPQG